MALFAELDSNNIIVNVIVVSDHDVSENGGDRSEQAALYVKNKFGKNTSNNFIQGFEDFTTRGHPPVVGGDYLPDEDVVRLRKYFPSWVWNSEIIDWQSPIGAKPTEDQWPENTAYVFWSEHKQTWVAHVIVQEEDIVIEDGHVTAVNTPGIYEIRDWDNSVGDFNATGTQVTMQYDS